MTGASWPDPPPWPPEVPPPWRPPPPETPRPAPGPPWPVVPTVPMPRPGQQDDVFGRLLERRIVLVSGSLGHDVANVATAQLMLLDATGDEPIDLHLSCPDGDLDASSAVADTVDLVGVEVRAWCRGTLGGPALAPLAAADRRFAHPHCVFALKDPTVQLEGRADQLTSLAAAHERQLAGLHSRLARATGQPLDRVVADMGRGLILSAEEAISYGLVEELARPERPGR